MLQILTDAHRTTPPLRRKHGHSPFEAKLTACLFRKHRDEEVLARGCRRPFAMETLTLDQCCSRKAQQHVCKKLMEEEEEERCRAHGQLMACNDWRMALELCHTRIHNSELTAYTMLCYTIGSPSEKCHELLLPDDGSCEAQACSNSCNQCMLEAAKCQAVLVPGRSQPGHHNHQPGQGDFRCSPSSPLCCDSCDVYM